MGLGIPPLRIKINVRVKPPETHNMSRGIGRTWSMTDLRGFDSSIMLIIRGGIPRPIGDFQGKLESSNLSRDTVSREIGRTSVQIHLPMSKGPNRNISWR